MANTPWQPADSPCSAACKFDEAVKWETKALEDEAFVRTEGKNARKRLELYESKKPYRHD